MGTWAQRMGLFALLGLTAAGALGYYGRQPALDASHSLRLAGASFGAEARLHQVLEENPADLEAWMALGEIYQGQRRLEEAFAAYETAVGLAPGEPAPLLRSALVQIRLGAVREAETRVLALVATRPVDSEAIKILGWIALKNALDRSTRIDGPSPDADRLAAADRQFARALRISPQDAEAFLGRALVARLLGHDVQALGLIDQAIARDSSLYWPWQVRGELLAALGRDSDARAALLEARARDGGRPYTLMELAALARDHQDPVAAADFMAGVGEGGAYNRGIDLLTAARLAEAEGAFLSALLVDPEDDLALDRLERVRMALYPADDTRRIELADRRMVKAARAEDVNNSLLAYFNYRRAVALAPQVSEARLRMARFFDRQGAYADAVIQLRRVEELTRSQTERLVASDLLEVITRKALTEMESTHVVRFGSLWEQPTGVLGDLVGNPEVLEERIRWSVTPVPRPRLRVVILPFTEAARPFHAGVGDLASEWLARTLGLLPGFELVSGADVEAALERRGAGSPGAIDPGVLGRDLGADLVVRGRILEAREDLALRVESLLVPSGPIVWRQEYVIRGSESLTRAVLEAARSLASQAPLSGSVVRRRERDILTVNLGRIHGVRVGDTLVINRPQLELLTPGLDWPGHRMEHVATGRVVGLTERYAEVRLAMGGAGAGGGVRTGDLVRRAR